MVIQMKTGETGQAAASSAQAAALQSFASMADAKPGAVLFEMVFVHRAPRSVGPDIRPINYRARLFQPGSVLVEWDVGASTWERCAASMPGRPDVVAVYAVAGDPFAHHERVALLRLAVAALSRGIQRLTSSGGIHA